MVSVNSSKYGRASMKIAVKAIFSVGFFLVLFSFINTSELFDVLGGIDWFYFILSFALTPVMLAASGLKWKLLLDKGGVAVPFGILIRIYLIGYFFSNILPSTVGGDVVRSYYSGREIHNQAYAAVAVFLERFTGLLMLCLLVVIMPLFAFELYLQPLVSIPALGGGVVLLTSVALYLKRNSLSRLEALIKQCARLGKSLLNGLLGRRGEGVGKKLDLIGGLITSKLGKLQGGMKKAVDELAGNRLFTLQIVALTVLFYLLAMVNAYVSFKAFGVEPDFLLVCVLIPAILFVAQIPVTLLGNLGYFESVFVGYFLLAGIGGAESLAMGLLLRLKMLTLGVVGLGVYLSYKKRKGEIGEHNSTEVGEEEATERNCSLDKTEV